MIKIGNFKTLGIGSLPYINADEAWQSILEHFPEIPFWPQLTKRSFLENMYVQFSENLPGLVLDKNNGKISIDTTQDLQLELERFYNYYLSENLTKFEVTRDYCEGIYSGLELIDQNEDIFNSTEFIKGQITGPISFGLQVVDQDRKPILYNESFYDLVVKNLQRKAEWQVMMLRKFNNNIILSVDEPYLSSIGSGFVNLNRDRIIKDIKSVFENINAKKAMHCCGNTDWSIITETSIDILLFDAYNYLNNIILFSADLKTFLNRGGILGWGIVPTTPEDLRKVNEEGLIKILEEGISALVKKGLEKDQIIAQSLITPSCGLGNLTTMEADKAMSLTRKISDHMRTKYGLE